MAKHPFLWGMPIQKIETGIPGLFVLIPKVFKDHRGYFLESYNQRSFLEIGLNYTFLQDNESLSNYGTLRGLHFQKGDAAQAKLVRVIRGEVLDVAVDLRRDSATFGRHYSTILTEENKHMMIIPRGFAHGFIVLSETALFTYKCDNLYAPDQEGSIHFADPKLAIDWRVPKDKILLSEKDAKAPPFEG